MTGLEIFLLILVIAALAAILVLASRNAELTRSTRKLFALLKVPAPVQPLPQAAEVIKLSNFDRATASRDAEIGELKREIAALKAAREEDDRRHVRSKQFLVDDLAAARRESERVAGLYKEAELARQRLDMENRRLAMMAGAPHN